jgi:hypothetical protein
MRLLDERYRLFGIVNPIDLVVILVVLAGAFVAANLLFGKAQPQAVQKNTIPITYSLRFENLRKSYADVSNFKVGDQVQKSGGKPIGKVASWRVEPSPRELLTALGAKAYSVTPSPEYRDVIITVKADAEKTAMGLLVADVQIRNNAGIPILTPTFEGVAKVEALTFDEAK